MLDSVINKQKTNDAGLNFLSAFQHPWCLSISMSMLHVHVHASCPCSCPCSCRTSQVCVRVRVHVRVCVYKCRNAGLSVIRSVRYWNEKTNDAGTSPVPDQAKTVRHFFVRYRTEIIDAGMPMPALVSWMPMPSYAYLQEMHKNIKTSSAETIAPVEYQVTARYEGGRFNIQFSCVFYRIILKKPSPGRIIYCLLL